MFDSDLFRSRNRSLYVVLVRRASFFERTVQKELYELVADFSIALRLLGKAIRKEWSMRLACSSKFTWDTSCGRRRLATRLFLGTALGLIGVAAFPAGAQVARANVVLLPSPQTAPASCQQFSAASPWTTAAGVSADGVIVAGNAQDLHCPVIWTNGTPTGLEQGSFVQTQGGLSVVTGISGDGRTIVGYSDDARYPARLWTEATGTVALPDPGPNEIAFRDVHIDGAGHFLAVNGAFYDGSQSPQSGSGYRAYRWSQNGGYEDIGNLGSGWSIHVNAIDGAGDRIVGSATDPSTFLNVSGARSAAFEWLSGRGMMQLPDLAAAPLGGTLLAYSEANGISRDGLTIAGASRGGDGFVQAAYWRSGAVAGLGFLPGHAPSSFFPFAENVTRALAASADGGVIIGTVESLDVTLPWRWTALSGMQDLNLFAANAGLNLGGFTLATAVGISDNGQVIVGDAFNQVSGDQSGYVLQLAQVTHSQLIVRITLPGVTQASVVNQTFNTDLVGVLNGEKVFSRSFADTIDSAAGAGVLIDARKALAGVSGLRRLVIGAPVLLSSATTVLSTRNDTVNVPAGTITNTATVNTLGPSAVFTGDLGVCASPAAGNTPPTGCSLSGTAVTIEPGILNSNIYTNRIESVTPTTTSTVEQLVSARWHIAATAGNQFGTVHALVGPVAFRQSDRLTDQLLHRGAGLVGTGANERRTGEVTAFAGAVDERTRIDADQGIPVARTRGSSDGFVVGLERRLSGGIRLGAALDHAESDFIVDDPNYPEGLAQRETQLAPYIGWSDGQLSLAAAVAYGFGKVETSIATPGGPANASRDLSAWSFGTQAGYRIPLSTVFDVDIVGGARHTSAALNSFTEAGGSSPLAGIDKTVSRTRLFAGAEATVGVETGTSVDLSARLYARYAHDLGDESGAADVVFAGIQDGSVMQALGSSAGRDVAEFGGNLEVAFMPGLAFWASADAQYTGSASVTSARAGLNWSF
jgi:uncharacterized membrane protein